MSAEQDEVDDFLKHIYLQVGRSCRSEFENIGRMMRCRREALDFSVWQVGMKIEIPFQDIELIEGGDFFDREDFDSPHFYRLLENILQLNEAYAYYEENPDVLKLDRLCKQLQDDFCRTHKKS